MDLENLSKRASVTALYSVSKLSIFAKVSSISAYAFLALTLLSSTFPMVLSILFTVARASARIL